MPTKETPEDLLGKHLGKDVAKTLLNKIDKMVKEGASADKIEMELNNDIATHVENQVNSILAVKIGPIEPIKIKPIQVAIKPAIKPTPAIKINSGISIKVSPQIRI